MIHHGNIQDPAGLNDLTRHSHILGGRLGIRAGVIMGNNDGGGLFAMAVTVWLSSIVMLIVNRKTLFAILGGIRNVLVPPQETATRSKARAVPA